MVRQHSPAGSERADSPYRMNIDTVRRLTKPKALGVRRCRRSLWLEMRLSGELASSVEFQAELLKLADHSGFDVSLQRDSVFRRNRRLVAFDMDSTLIAEEVMDELANATVWAKWCDTDAAMAGARLQGELQTPCSSVKGHASRRITRSRRVCGTQYWRTPSDQGAKTFRLYHRRVLGGFQYVVNICSSVGIDYVYANELEVWTEYDRRSAR